jgi:hypothetical protein
VCKFALQHSVCKVTVRIGGSDKRCNALVEAIVGVIFDATTLVMTPRFPRPLLQESASGTSVCNCEQILPRLSAKLKGINIRALIASSLIVIALGAGELGARVTVIYHHPVDGYVMKLRLCTTPLALSGGGATRRRASDPRIGFHQQLITKTHEGFTTRLS